MNKTVTFNDKLLFNHIIGKAIIENNRIKLNEQDVSNLTKRIEGVKYYRFIQNNFKDVYYLQDENVWLDRVVSNIFQMNHYQPHVLQYKRSLAYYSLFQSSIIKRPFNLFHRKNLLRGKRQDRPAEIRRKPFGTDRRVWHTHGWNLETRPLRRGLRDCREASWIGGLADGGLAVVVRGVSSKRQIPRDRQRNTRRASKTLAPSSRHRD